MVRSAANFFVEGLPAPQGSKIPITRAGKTVLIEASKGFLPWRNAVKRAAMQERNRNFTFFEQAITVTMVFVMPKPPNTKYKDHPAGKPDLDKLVRNTCDGLVQGNLLKDDQFIVHLDATKRWAIDGEPTGCWVRIDKVTVL